MTGVSDVTGGTAGAGSDAGAAAGGARIAGRATIGDVAREAGVSQMSVSRAVRGIEGVSETTRAHVLAVASRLGYQPNFNARSLAISRSRLVGVNVPTLVDEVFGDILEALRSTLDGHGLDLIMVTSDYDRAAEERWVERMLKWSPAGLILTGGDHAPDLAARLRPAEIPVVELWDAVPDPIDVCVGVEHGKIGAMAAEHLLACGCRSACLIGLDGRRDPRAEKRFAGFIDVFGQSGEVSVHRVADGASFEAGASAVTRLRAGGCDGCDAYFFLNDHLAFGGLCALERLGVDVPGEVCVMGFNDLGINRVLNRRITTITTPRWKIGEIAGQRLLARIHGAVTPRVTALEPELIPGQTTRA